MTVHLIEIPATPAHDDDPTGQLWEAAERNLPPLPDLLRAELHHELQEAAAGPWTATEHHLHPRWPENTPGGLGGQFMRVGQRFNFGGKEWEIANVVQGRLIAHEASGNQAKVETKEFDPAKTAGAATTLTGATRATARVITGGKNESTDVTIVDPYVDHASHDPSLKVPENGKVTEEAWKRFGRLEQLHYIDLQERYGKHTASGAAGMISAAYKDYDAGIQDLVHSGYAAQYGSSSGSTLSLVKAFIGGYGKPTGAELEGRRVKRETAIELQSRIRDAYAWDLYNRTKSPDVSLFHKDGQNGKHWWQKFANGQGNIFSGLSQSHHFRRTFFGNTTFATPTSIRHIVMATYVAGPMKNSEKSFTGEKEMAIPYQFKAGSKSMAFDNSSVPNSYLTWLENTTTTPMGGAHLEQFKNAVEKGEHLPIPPPAPEIHLHGTDALPPPPEALKALQEFSSKLPQIGNGVTPEVLKATGLPFAHHENGLPMAVSALDAGYKPGDFLMGKQGTLYWAGPNPTDTSGYGLTIHKLVPDGSGGLQTNGETFAFDSSHHNYKLLANVPPPKVEETHFDPEAWVFEDAKPTKLQSFQPGDKFKVDGTAYEVMSAGTASQTPIKNLESGQAGYINSDYSSVKLAPKEGYEPPGQKIQVGKGMSLAYEGKKHIVTSVKADGTVSIKPSTGGHVVSLAHDDPALADAFDHTAWQIGKTTTAGELTTGDIFHLGAGENTIRPHKVVGNDGTWVYWKNLDKGTEGKFLQKKKVRGIVDVKGAEGQDQPKPDGPKAKPVESPPISTDEGPQPVPAPPPPGKVGEHHGYTEGQVVELKKMDGTTWKATVVGGGKNSYGNDVLQVEAPTKKEGLKTYTMKLEKVVTPPHEATPEDTPATVPSGWVENTTGLTLQDLPPGAQMKVGGVVHTKIGDGPEGPWKSEDTGQTGLLGKGFKPAEVNVQITPGPDTSAAAASAHDKALDGLPDIGLGYSAYKSSHGPKGAYKHDKISAMPEGTVFQDKTGTKFKVQATGSTPIITDGTLHFTINGDLRGKALHGETLDAPAPPAKPAIVSPPPGAPWHQDLPGFMKNQMIPGLTKPGEGLTLKDLPVGTIYPSDISQDKFFVKTSDKQIQWSTIDGITLAGAINFDPDYAPPATKQKKAIDLTGVPQPPPISDDLPALGSLNPGESIMGGDGEPYIVVGDVGDGKVAISHMATGDNQWLPKETLPSEIGVSTEPKSPEAIGDVKAGEYFKAQGSNYKVVAHASTGTVLQDENGGLWNLPPDTAIKSIGAVIEPPTGSSSDPLGELAAGDEFEGANGQALMVVSKTASGKVIVGEPHGTTMEMLDGDTPLNEISITPITTVPDPEPDVTSGDKDYGGEKSAELKKLWGYSPGMVGTYEPITLNGYKSAWGSGGKYKHDWLGDLNPGDRFQDKDGNAMVYVQGTGDGKVLIWLSDSNAWRFADAKVRVRKK